MENIYRWFVDFAANYPQLCQFDLAMGNRKGVEWLQFNGKNLHCIYLDVHSDALSFYYRVDLEEGYAYLGDCNRHSIL